MEKLYQFAGVEIAVHIPADRMYEDARTLSPFSVCAVEDPHHFRFEVVPALTPPDSDPVIVCSDFHVYEEHGREVRFIGTVKDDWRSAHIRAVHDGKEHAVQLKAEHFSDRVGPKTVMNAIAAEQLVARAGGFILHASYILWEGKAILFTAPSGTGKSTQAELWRTLRGAEIINGDRAAVRIAGGQVCAAGVPFAGSSQICKNVTAPLAAIVYLGQAKQTSIRQLGGFEAFRRIWEGVSVNTWNRGDVALVSETVQRVVQSVPVYHLPCTPDESAVNALEQALRK